MKASVREPVSATPAMGEGSAVARRGRRARSAVVEKAKCIAGILYVDAVAEFEIRVKEGGER